MRKLLTWLVALALLAGGAGAVAEGEIVVFAAASLTETLTEHNLYSYSDPIRHYHFFEKAPKHPLKAKGDLLPVKGMFRKQCLF